MTPTPGMRLGPYELQSLVGAGGMGDVYKARDTRLGRIVAIKLAKEQFSARFEREARAVAALNHPHVCTLYDVGPNYLVMEFIDGTPIKGPLAVDAAITYGAQILDALQAAHERGIVHRDLKPANILITKGGVKLLDFGLATAVQSMSLADGVTREQHTRLAVITQSGDIMGTPAYMSPEQWEGKPADPRSDIYAFGMVLYEMFTGMRAGRERPPLRQSALEHVVQRCLANDPSDRFTSAAEVKRALVGATGRTTPMWLGIAAAAAVLLMAGTGFLMWERGASATPLTDQDVLVVADFDNRTGDPVFDTALKQALVFQLEQSPFLKAMDDVQVRQALTLSGRSPDDRVTAELARQICIREDEKATLQGSITRLGSSYLLAVEATNCRTGQTLAREQVEAGSKEQIVATLAQGMTSMRVKLGESLPAIEGETRSYVHNVSTNSLEALQAFHLADAQWFRTGDRRSAIPFYERATQLDPNFALAWAILGLQYGGSGDPERWKSYSAKAYGMVDRVSERERLVITSMYHLAHGDDAKSIEINEVLARTYSRDPILHINFAALLLARGDWLTAIEESRLAIRHGPKIVQGYNSMVSALLALERTDEAKQVIAQAFAEGVDAPALHSTQLYIAYAEGDLQTQERERKWFSGKPLEVFAMGQEANNSAALGRFQAAMSQYQKAVDAARQRNAGNPTALLGEKAMMAALFENCRVLDAAERKAPDIGALCGNDVEAWKFVERQSKTAPGVVASGPDAYLQGVMLLRVGKTAEARTHFQKMVGRRALNWGPEYPAAFIGLARAATRRGDITTAKKAYEDFFVLWKDADPDIPLLVAARKEYSALQ